MYLLSIKNFVRHCEPEGRSNLPHRVGDCFVGLRPPRNDGVFMLLLIQMMLFDVFVHRCWKIVTNRSPLCDATANLARGDL